MPLEYKNPSFWVYIRAFIQFGQTVPVLQPANFKKLFILQQMTLLIITYLQGLPYKTHSGFKVKKIPYFKQLSLTLNPYAAHKESK
ncbi:hypothetical protein B9G39_10345 [Zooshikella ganghwensis]|uniref:Uncharacterized protein n=1 Tax=Zooshikella ganghwensis TaxID=202772 RepID=A0A4P9VMH5_9GAMM|nr:hypothetical protein B9G39_10345 [Zooshikella ganghwensis]